MTRSVLIPRTSFIWPIHLIGFRWSDAILGQTRLTLLCVCVHVPTRPGVSRKERTKKMKSKRPKRNGINLLAWLNTDSNSIGKQIKQIDGLQSTSKASPWTRSKQACRSLLFPIVLFCFFVHLSQLIFSLRTKAEKKCNRFVNGIFVLKRRMRGFCLFVFFLFRGQN